MGMAVHHYGAYYYCLLWFALLFGHAPSLFIPHFPSQELAHFGLGQHVAEFDIAGNFVRGQPLGAPADQIGAPHTPGIFLKTWVAGSWGAVLWLLVFYLMLVGSKIGVSILAGHTKRWIQSSAYIWLNRILGMLLLFFAAGLARDGFVLITS